jgi:hypothetical protein
VGAGVVSAPVGPSTLIATSANQPVTAVAATLVKSPQILMWDPANHPDWPTIIFPHEELATFNLGIPAHQFDDLCM